jgi:hypothetical protein
MLRCYIVNLSTTPSCLPHMSVKIKVYQATKRSFCEAAVVEEIVAYNNPRGVIREAIRWFQISKSNSNERGIVLEELIGKSREDMPTKPLESVLYREFAKAQLQEIFVAISPLEELMRCRLIISLPIHYRRSR